MMLQVRDLSILFHDGAEPFTAVDRFNLEMSAGEIVGIVGESGSGKSMTSHAIMGLLRRKGVELSGSICFGAISRSAAIFSARVEYLLFSITTLIA